MPGQPNLETILRTGQVLRDQYRVEGLIAKGGMAAVWAGVNQHTGKRVALKVILRSFAANGDAAELFRREALAASKVNHPNVVSIFDVIDHEDATCIVMELLDGETLATYLTRAGPLTLEATVALLVPAMCGVAAAHAQGVVHRDLKPANIFLCTGPDGRLLTTKVLDFGIAVMLGLTGKALGASAPLAKFGTPAYMAPEAIEMSSDIDGRADVYGFGVLFFEALTGKLPFPGPPGMELLGRILTDPAPMVTLYRPDLPSGVVDLIACALAKAPSARFADMDHLIRATEDLMVALPPASHAHIPGSGIVAIPPVASDAGTAVPRVRATFEGQPRGGRHPNATRALYSMAGNPQCASDGAGPDQGKRPATATTASRSRGQHLSRPDGWRRGHRQVSLGAAFVVFAFTMAWANVPASSKDSGLGYTRSSGVSVIAVPAPGPRVTQLPSLPTPAPSPASTPELDGAVPPTVEPSRHAGARRPPKSVPRRALAIRPPPAAGVPDEPSASRAGILSPSDF